LILNRKQKQFYLIVHVKIIMLFIKLIIKGLYIISTDIRSKNIKEIENSISDWKITELTEEDVFLLSI